MRQSIPRFILACAAEALALGCFIAGLACFSLAIGGGA